MFHILAFFLYREVIFTCSDIIHLKTISLTNNLLSFQTCFNYPSSICLVKSLCSSLTEHWNNKFPTLFVFLSVNSSYTIIVSDIIGE